MVAKKEQPPVLIEPREDLVRAAKQAAVGIAERAPEADRNRRVPVENILDLHEAGLLTVAIPADLGGSEADLVFRPSSATPGYPPWTWTTRLRVCATSRCSSR